MNNHTYIIASIPALSADSRPGKEWCADTIRWIDSQLDGHDRAALAMVREGFTPEALCEDFYLRALQSGSRFIREFFCADLALRNAKVDFLNSALGRAEGTDVIRIEGMPERGDAKAVSDLFGIGTILEREKAMDKFLWEVADGIVRMDVFSLDCILGIAAKILIINRWMALDENTGRQMLGRLVEGVRGSYGKIEFETLK